MVALPVKKDCYTATGMVGFLGGIKNDNKK
jgi:hypothetical protein